MMKVLFVASGNGKVNGVSSFILSQYKSLENIGIDMQMFPVDGHGVSGYCRNITKLRKAIKEFKPDIVHAHYSVCGYLATLACLGLKVPVYTSILGSFLWCSKWRTRLVAFCIRHIWDGALVKSQRTADELGVKVPVVPNGVNLSQFSLMDRQMARTLVGMRDDTRYVLFITNPQRVEKNYALAQAAMDILHQDKQYADVVLQVVNGVTHDKVVQYMCGGDVVLMTSLTEGSPNVIKEAMACNCRIVTTDCGDTPWLMEHVDGGFLCVPNTPEVVAENIKKALAFRGQSNGREVILELGLTTEQVAQKILKLYNDLLKSKV